MRYINFVYTLHTALEDKGQYNKRLMQCIKPH